MINFKYAQAFILEHWLNFDGYTIYQKVNIEFEKLKYLKREHVSGELHFNIYLTWYEEKF